MSQLLDGNLLVPLLFSEAVNLHPFTIIVSVLIFGGLWGFGEYFCHPISHLGESQEFIFGLLVNKSAVDFFKKIDNAFLLE